MLQSLRHNTWISDLVLLTLLIGFAFSITLGFPALYITDEGRYAEIGREMLLLHHFVTPHLDGLPYFEKPPLAYWFIALFEWLFGLNEWAVRFVNVFFALLICGMVYTTGRICFNRLTGIWSTLILSSSLLFFAVTRLLNTDTCFTACLTLALTSFIIWFKTREEGRPYPTLLYLAYAGCGLAVLAKGLIGIIFPGMILGFWLLFTRNWKLLKVIRLPTGLLLFLLIAAPWHILAQRQNPTFYHQYFYVNQYLRFVTPIMHREMDKVVYIGLFFGGFLPWMLILLRHYRVSLHAFLKPRSYPVENFLLWWILSIFLFFGFSNSILPPYLLPTLPPLALLTAPTVAHLWQKGHKKMRGRLIATVLVTWLIFNISWVVAPTYVHKSTKSLAEITNTLLQAHPNAVLINYNYYFQDFPFYTQHFVQIVNWQDELAYGQKVDPTLSVLINSATFWNIVKSPKIVYVVMNDYDFEKIVKMYPNTLFLLAQTNHYVLATNAMGVAE